jgi:hypothetical protein
MNFSKHKPERLGKTSLVRLALAYPRHIAIIMCCERGWEQAPPPTTAMLSISPNAFPWQNWVIGLLPPKNSPNALWRFPLALQARCGVLRVEGNGFYMRISSNNCDVFNFLQRKPLIWLAWGAFTFKKFLQLHGFDTIASPFNWYFRYLPQL